MRELATLDACDRGAAGDGRGACRRRIADDGSRDRRRDRARDRSRGPISPSRSRNRCLHDYERRRAQNRGAGAARLVGTTCQACHLTIPSTEAEQVRRERGQQSSRTATTAPPSSFRDPVHSLFARPSSRARPADAHLDECSSLRRRLARQPRAVGDRCGRARPVDRSAPAPGRGERVHRDHDEQRRGVQGADRRARVAAAPFGAHVACACGPTPSSSSNR